MSSQLVKNKKERVYERKIEDKENHFENYFEFDTNTKSRFVRISMNR